MANELTLSAQVYFLTGTIKEEWQELDKQFTVAGTKKIRNVQTVGTSEELIQLGDVSVGGYCMCKNHDDTNFVQIRGATGETDLIRLEPLDVAMFRIDDGATPYAIADTSSCEVEFLIVEA